MLIILIFLRALQRAQVEINILVKIIVITTLMIVVQHVMATLLIVMKHVLMILLIVMSLVQLEIPTTVLQRVQMVIKPLV